MVTIFKTLKDTKNPYYRPVHLILERIKDGSSKEIISKLRLESDKEKRNELKLKLPAICFSGKFRERNTAGLTSHSGLICLDWDNVKDPVTHKKMLSNKPFVYSAFISPSGRGVKALIKIPTDDHAGSFFALEKEFLTIDKSGKDVSRVCYESYDPEIYINPDAETYTKKMEITYEKIDVTTPVTDYDKLYEIIKKWLDNKGEYFTMGNRNNFLCKLASACNRFGIPKDVTREYLMYDYVNGATQFRVSELDSIIRSVYGNYTHQFATAVIEDQEIVEKETHKVISEEILDMEIPAKDVIRVKDIEPDMIEEFDQGITMHETTHFERIDEIFRWNRGDINVLHGIGNHGKSTMLNQLTLVKSIRKDYRWATFSPEQHPPKRYYNDLIQMYVGKTTFKGQYQMSKKEYLDGLAFMNEHYYYIYPKDEIPTIDYIFERFAEVIAKEKIDGVIIDPFNQVSQDFKIRDDQYISETMSRFKKFIQQQNVFSCIVAHPKGGLEKKDDGNLDAPYYTQIAGGAMWGNKADNILCYHRPYMRTDPSNPVCIFGSQKVKDEQRSGRKGMVKLEYDRHRFRLYEMQEGVGGNDEFTQRLPHPQEDSSYDFLQSDEIIF